ncbi:MAG: hypothetical protein OEY33_07035, partial [Bdellovibrionales bacterium]|nr:hypothetical protein [Bdellovibrionales bacterium]
SGNSFGGFVGRFNNSSAIYDSYSTGHVSGNITDAGGFAGYVDSSSNYIYRSYSTGTITSSQTSNVEGFKGYNSGTHYIYDSFWNTDPAGENLTTATSSGDNAKGRTLDRLKQRSNYGSWDFKTIWEIDEGNDTPRHRAWRSTDAEPISLAVQTLTPYSVKLMFKHPLDNVTNFKVAYKEGSTAPGNCSVPATLSSQGLVDSATFDSEKTARFVVGDVNSTNNTNHSQGNSTFNTGPNYKIPAHKRIIGFAFDSNDTGTNKFIELKLFNSSGTALTESKRFYFSGTGRKYIFLGDSPIQANQESYAGFYTNAITGFDNTTGTYKFLAGDGNATSNGTGTHPFEVIYEDSVGDYPADPKVAAVYQVFPEITGLSAGTEYSFRVCSASTINSLTDSNISAGVTITVTTPSDNFIAGASDVSCDGTAYTTCNEIGAGTEASPYIICNQTQLYNIGSNATCYASGKHIKLGQDIDLSSSIRIANFQGVFDGNNHTIYDFQYQNFGLNQVGLFTILNGATIKNLKLKNVNISGNRDVGALAGYAIGKSKISNVHVEGKMQSDYDIIGGMIGSLDGGSIIENSSAKVEVIRTAATVNTQLYLGGLVGRALGGALIRNSKVEGLVFNDCSDGTDENCASTGGLAGEIYGKGTKVTNSEAHVQVISDDLSNGGFVGRLHDHAVVEDSFATGNVKSRVQNDGWYNGGFAGRIWSNGECRRCYATGDVEGFQGHNGGFVGDIRGNGSYIGQSYATGNVYSPNDGNGYYVGGFIGYANERVLIEDSFATGNVYGNDTYIGGFVGRNDSYVMIKRSFAKGDVTGTNGPYVGGFVGGHETYSVIEDSYAQGDVSSFSSHLAGFVGRNNDTDTFIKRSYSSGTVIGGTSSIGGFSGTTISGNHIDSYFN